MTPTPRPRDEGHGCDQGEVRRDEHGENDGENDGEDEGGDAPCWADRSEMIDDDYLYYPLD